MKLDWTAFTPEKRMARELNGGAIVLPIGRLSWTNDLTVGSENQRGTWTWMATVLFPPETDFQIAHKLMYPIALEKTKDKDRAKTEVLRRFLDPNNKPGGGKPEGLEFNGWTMVRMSTTKKPDIMLPNGSRCENAEELQRECYSGRWAFATATAYWFDVGTNKGVSLGLQNIILQDHDEPMGGSKPRGTEDYNALAAAGIVDASAGGQDDPFGTNAPDEGGAAAPDEDDDIPF